MNVNVGYLLTGIMGGLGLIAIIKAIVAHHKYSSRLKSESVGKTPINVIGPFVLPPTNDDRWKGRIRDGIFSYRLSSIYLTFYTSGRSMVFVDGQLLNELLSPSKLAEEVNRKLDLYAQAVKASYDARPGVYVVESTVDKVQATLESINSQGSSGVVGRGEPS
jgi:hypothetical protein